MKKFFFLIFTVVLVTLTSSLYGQIGMSIELNRTAYMQFEPVYAKITFRNDTGKDSCRSECSADQ